MKDCEETFNTLSELNIVTLFDLMLTMNEEVD